MKTQDLNTNRFAKKHRKTLETDISLTLCLDGQSNTNIQTGIGFFDHMLCQLTKHSSISLDLIAKGDTKVDAHHLVEDVGICLGEALKEALGDKMGIARYGQCLMPMDSCLTMVVLDLSGRSCLKYDLDLKTPCLGTMETETIEEFFLGFVRGSHSTLHIKTIESGNTHHVIESAFKGFAQTLKQATFQNGTATLPTTKGLL